MQAYVVPAGCKTLDELRRVERENPRPGRGQVLVRVRATSLNRRDQAIVSGTYFGSSVSVDTIPLSDCAGEVAEIGDGVSRWKPGDRVMATFFQIPPNGSPFATRQPLGSPLDGVLVERIAVYEEGLVRMPAGFSFEEAACLPCAAVTAWNALMVAGRPVGPADVVLVLGTGGVSIFALQLAVAAGARVIATSSSDVKLERVKALGASATVNYARTPEWHKEVLKLTGGRGVDCVVEVAGVATLERSFESVAERGKVCLIGVLTGRSADINPYGLMWKEAALYGIRVGDRQMFERMTAAMETDQVKPVIDRVFAFDDALAAYGHQLSGQFVGKVVIAV